MFVRERFVLSESTIEHLSKLKPEFGYNGFGEMIFYRTYSRTKPDGSKENWHDVVRRVTEGTFSIRKDWYVKNHITWDETFWQDYAKGFAESMFKMYWLPPGRGLWAMGTDYVYERGSMALYNCAATEISDNIGDDSHWLMDCLMNGVGVGFEPLRNDDLKTYEPKNGQVTFVIEDSREGWCDSVKILIDKHLKPNQSSVEFDYSQIRRQGLPIKGFGGISSGPEPLKYLHTQIIKFFKMYRELDWYDSVILKSDIENAIGCCVVAGNVRRSAELNKGKAKDPVFMNLKNYDLYPHRAELGWMSNNSVALENDEDFDQLGEIARLVIRNGEPGYINVQNLYKGRIGKRDDVRPDKATLFNPCVPYETRILTDKGYVSIGDVVDQKVNVWNGKEYSEVVPFATGFQDTLEVELSDGTFFRCTPNHEFIIALDYHGNTTRIQAENLSVGDKLAKFDLPVIESGEDYSVDAYSQGFYSGDGNTDLTHSWLYEPKYSCKNALIGTLGKEDRYNRRRWSHGPMYDKAFVPINGTKKYCLEWLAGLIDSDGTATYNDNGANIQIASIDRNFLNEIRVMLTRLGVQSKVTSCRDAGFRGMPDGKGGSKEYYCQKTYRLLLGSMDVHNLIELGMKLLRVIIPFTKPQRDAKRFITVKAVYDSFPCETYCFTEPKNHTGTFEGIVTGQCGEIPLENKETCNVAESLPTRCPTKEDWLKGCEYATVYMSTVSLLPTHRPETNAVIARNRRIGASIIDYTGWVHEKGQTFVIRAMREGYNGIRKINRWVNQEAGVPEAIRVTTIKPGGTIPKIAGRTPGIGFPTFRLTNRRVRVNSNSHICQVLKDAGVPHEPDVTQPDVTTVFSFAIEQGPSKPISHVSLWEQAINLVTVQREWADNAVSNTLYFRPKWKLIQVLPVPNAYGIEESIQEPDFKYEVVEEYGEKKVKIYCFDTSHEEDIIEQVLSTIAPLTKSVSLLPHSPVGVYPQMPESELSEEEFRNMAVPQIDWTQFKDEDALIEDEKYCSGLSCELPKA